MNEFEPNPPRAAAKSGVGDHTGTESAAAHGAADTAASDEATHAQSATQALPPGVLPVVAVRDTVLFPGTVFPLAIGRATSIRAVQHAMHAESPIGILLQRDAETVDPAAVDLHEVGTIANILRYVNAPDGGHHIVVQGLQRFRVLEFVEGQPFLAARVEPMVDPEEQGTEIEARMLHLRQQAIEALQLLPSVPQELTVAVQSVGSAGALADLVCAYLDTSVGEKQDLLETADLAARIDKVSAILAKRIEVMRLTREIGQRTKATFDERQREAILREQMASIQRELGEEGGKSAEVAELGKAIDAAQMPDAAREIAHKELRRYERMSDGAPEAGMVRNYLDWLTELPWAEPEPRPIDIHEARRVLDEDHFGLDKIKQRIIEFLAVRKLAPHGKAPILCFVGPPGVGKTSLGQSIARAMGRPFAHVSLGGVHDEAEIRGHRRTYIGSMPGNIIQAIRKAKARDCVMMLDEIDKMGRGVQGDPSAAMLEVLDPEQNSTFRDNYLGVTFDLSRVTFITTANMLDTVPGPLRDRMEIISLAGYTESEKFEIARRYLVRRELEANGLRAGQATITDDALRQIIRDYTREAGVRNLEREIGRSLRHAALRIAEGATEHVDIDADALDAILGPPRFDNEAAMRTSTPGVATGLAWTPVGGSILFIEATSFPGKGGLILTGQLGDVMRESAQAALSIVKHRAHELGIDEKHLGRLDIHIHVPAGATPKDGPSAGVAMFTALVSLLTARTVRSDTAMTGEISLRGLVLPVGGIKEKIVAAAAAGITRVMLPARNRRDFEEIPAEAREHLEFIWLERVDDAIAAALEPAHGKTETEAFNAI
ncbi:MAG: endopeptidase La [Rhodanobacter sp.]|nr:MAG: endopeptidase La [Rhodanobacter sp.]TAM04594.1 MAG: endopeptidase La [Rhodanobacter sp.]TAM39296.1 MAG: endopeptidase La [Rhodanobacter sp.]TAN28713.1 MAG: endopeptidase La [Rhodanobacter sp.]